jgi:hypothetical protein
MSTNIFLKLIIFLFFSCIATSRSIQAGREIDLENMGPKRRYEQAIDRPTHAHVEKGVKNWGQFYKHLCDYEELLFSDQPSPRSLAKKLKKMCDLGALDETSYLFQLVEDIENFYENLGYFIEKCSQAENREPQTVVEEELAEDIEENHQTNEYNQEAEEKKYLFGALKEGNIQEREGDKESERYFKQSVQYFNHLRTQWESNSSFMECLRNEEYYIIGWAAAIIGETVSYDLIASDKFLHHFFEARKYDPARYLLAYLSSNDLKHFSLAKSLKERQFSADVNLEREFLKKREEAACRRIKIFLFTGSCCVVSTAMGLTFMFLYMQLPQHFRQ